MFDKDFNPSPEQIVMLAKAGSIDYNESMKSAREVAKAVEGVLREGLLPGDILDGIFKVVPLSQNATSEFPLHFLAPGTEKEFVAFTIPNHGYIPQAHVEGDKVMVPCYPIGCSIDTNLRYLRDARWDVLGSMMEVMRNQVTKKLNDDGFHTLLAAGVDRNIVVYDSDASQGQFTKRLVSLAKTVMRRNGGGNSGSSNRSRLTDIVLSPEAMEDIRNWGVDQVDEVTRREIYVADEGSGSINRIFGVNLRDLDEFGDGQEYELFFDQELSGTLPSGDVELLLGLDLSKTDSFVMPVRESLQIFEDPTLHRHQRMGFYGWQEQGFAVLDNRRVILLSI